MAPEPPFDPGNAADELERALRASGDPDRARQEKRYLKSELEHFGVSVPVIRRVSIQFAKEGPELDREALLRLVEELWRRPVHECRMAAVEFLDQHGPLLEPRDLDLIERFIRQSRTWALVDGLAASVAGPLVERHPELVESLDRWSRDDDFWVRRSALLALLLPLRRGDGDFDRFASYAD